MFSIKSTLLNFLVYGSLVSNVLSTTTITEDEKLPDTSNDPYLRDLINGLKDIKSNFSDIPVRSGRSSVIVNLKVSDEAESKRISKYAGAAYCLDLTLKPWTCNHCKKIGSNIVVQDVFTEFITGGRGFIATDATKKQIILSFRGSSNIQNWLGNLNLIFTNYNVNNGGSDIQVHAGFKDGINALYPKFSPLLKSLVASHPDYKLIITGHSLGGALATLASIEIQKNFNLSWDRMQLFTYGEPRVGNTAFVEWFNRQSLTLTRVVNNKDIVPHVPPRKFGYSQHQREMHLRDNKAKVCSTTVLEDPTCALSTEPFLSILDHLTYWDGFLGGVC
ncbi:alpha/beta-hydrolase, partial [Neoconidiobolus thromboides FSU 785]